MKRRMFLSSAGMVGIVGAASGGAPILSSAYSSISKNVSLADFSTDSKKVLDGFVKGLTDNFASFDQGTQLVNRIAMPVRIISTNFKKNNHRIVYKNQVGDYVTLTMKNGVESIHISDKL